jgi:hypothetical protein
VLLNTLIKFRTVITSLMKATVRLPDRSGFQAPEYPGLSFDSLPWTTIRTTGMRWEAELMQQVLAAHEVPARIIDLGIESYMGQGSPAALQVHVDNKQLATLLLSVVDETTEASD